MTWLLALALALAILLAQVLLNPDRNQRRNANTAAELITQAGSEFLRGLYDEAYLHYKQARDIAHDSKVYILEAEGYYGMALVYQRRRDYNSAAACLRSILATRDHWGRTHPDYGSLVERYLAEIEAKLAP